MTIHFYMLCYRTEALVASHLDPDSFGRYMAIGTHKLTKGNVIFFEIDPSLKSSYFKVDDIAQRCVPHADGSPKRSKYIGVYRVLEHLPMESIGSLYLVTADGRVLKLDSDTHTAEVANHGVHLYYELCPISPLVVSALPPGRFAHFMTNPTNPVHVPRIFFADLLLEQDETGHLAGYLPYHDPMHLLQCVEEVRKGGNKPTKTVSRNPVHHGFFRTIYRGFFLGDQKHIKVYRFPERRELEVEHSRWWRSASESLS